MPQEVDKLLDAAEHAQEEWAGRVVRNRLKLIGRLPALLLESHAELRDAIPRPNATAADKLGSELMPLADACRFVARRGRQILAPQSHSSLRGRWWMGRIGVTRIREPWGTVLILAPSNYPLLLPGVQVVQALAAGNAAVVKPAPGCAEVMQRFKQCLVASGIPADLVQILDTDVESARQAMELGVDKVVLTGSAATGRAVARQLADSLTPSTMELSGCDAAFITPKANLKRAAECIRFGLRLNGGATCIAPRRIFVLPKQHDDFVAELQNALTTGQASNQGKNSSAPATYAVERRALSTALEAVQAALSEGARLLVGELPTDASTGRMPAIVLDGVRPSMQVAREDIFAPITSIIAVDDLLAAINADRTCPYALGASVFGPRSFAEHWADEIHAGCVVVNDVIAPTADPRVAFGGWDRSGWGVTRGPEGLLDMTRLKVVCVRKGNWLPHLDPLAHNEPLLLAMFRMLHGANLSARFHGLRELIRLGRNLSQSKNE